ncbi:MAG: hypothetical protein FJ125_16310, partial [Deltaproteobacteria bacterium]|nr:hypothetical protein [Deltaproteobacteria bacterium]
MRVQIGLDRNPTLVEALEEERNKIKEFYANRDRFRGRLERLNRGFREAANRYLEMQSQARHQVVHLLRKASSESRCKLLGRYYLLDRQHGKLLDELTSYLLAGSEDDHSPSEVSLIRFALNHLIFAMRNEERKAGGPTVFHSIEAARGVAKNGQCAVTILATLLHDLVEDKLDEWSKELIHECIDSEESYGMHRGKSLKQLPDSVRSAILRRHIDEYNDRAAGIYYGIGLSLYSHVRLLHSPERYYQMLHSLMEMLARLSRTRDISYYNYLEKVLYPPSRPQELDRISRGALLEVLVCEVSEPETLLDEYLRDIDGFYQTAAGIFTSRDEVVRNSFREVLAKILDRLNNTRDMSREEGFSVPKRLYGAGYKNIYFVQAVEHRLRLPGLTSEERRIIESKFISKPKVAALYQMLEDVRHLEQQISPEQMRRLREELDHYKCRPDFHIITSPDRGSLFDGIILLFNETILGNKAGLESLHDQPLRQA